MNDIVNKFFLAGDNKKNLIKIFFNMTWLMEILKI